MVPSLLCVRMITENDRKVLRLEQKCKRISKRQIFLPDAHEWHPHILHMLALPPQRLQTCMEAKTET